MTMSHKKKEDWKDKTDNKAEIFIIQVNSAWMVTGLFIPPCDSTKLGCETYVGSQWNGN